MRFGQVRSPRKNRGQSKTTEPAAPRRNGSQTAMLTRRPPLHLNVPVTDSGSHPALNPPTSMGLRWPINPVVGSFSTRNGKERNRRRLHRPLTVGKAYVGHSRPINLLSVRSRGCHVIPAPDQRLYQSVVFRKERQDTSAASRSAAMATLPTEPPSGITPHHSTQPCIARRRRLCRSMCSWRCLTRYDDRQDVSQCCYCHANGARVSLYNARTDPRRAHRPAR